MLIKAKMATFPYLILYEACQTMLNLIEDWPIHPLHLKNFLKRFYPSSQAVTPQTMFNFCLKMQGSPEQVWLSGEWTSRTSTCSVWSQESREYSWALGHKPNLFLDIQRSNAGGAFRECWGFWWANCNCKNMEKVKQYQGNKYYYRVLYIEDGHPAGLMFITPN